ncbi:hypothetical protein ABPG75_002564 [Micractinium tetrahymenae]
MSETDSQTFSSVREAPDVYLRPACAADVAPLAQLYASAFEDNPAYRWIFSGSAYQPAPPGALEWLFARRVRLLVHCGCPLLVVVDRCSGRLVGAAALSPFSRKPGMLHFLRHGIVLWPLWFGWASFHRVLSIDKKLARLGRGIGRRLLRALLALWDAEHGGDLVLATQQEHALRLYKAHGFREPQHDATGGVAAPAAASAGSGGAGGAEAAEAAEEPTGETALTPGDGAGAAFKSWVLTVLFGRHSGQPAAHEPSAVTITASSLVMTADETYAFTAKTGQHKWEYPLPKLFILGILAGAYIGLGYSLCCLCAGLLSPEFRQQNPGAFNILFGIYGFPMGLTLCVVAGGDLFTSNCMYSAVGCWEGKFGLIGWLRMLVVSYFSNLVGALLLVGLMKGADVFHGTRSSFLIELAEHKCSYGWGAVLLRGVLGNWLVCLAVWQGNMARDFAGKAIGVWLPDAAFVSMGLEHCIANMFLVPMAMSLGAPITAAQFIRRNLIPATLGNLIGGTVLVASAYACSLGSPGHALQDAWEDGLARMGAAWRDRRAARAVGGNGASPFAHPSGKSVGGASNGGNNTFAPLPLPTSASAHRSSSGSGTFQLAASAGGSRDVAGAAGPLPARSPRRRAGQGAMAQP